MSDHFDVSVIIPSYNSEAFLKRSVLSCLQQEGVTVEVIVVDDQGKDFTRDILEKIQHDNPDAPLKSIYRPGGLGQATARNDGMKGARGRYIALLDSDDGFCDNSVLAQWVAEADRDSLEMSVARFYNISTGMARTPARQIDLERSKSYTLAEAPELVNVVSCWQILYRRDFLEQNEIIFSPRLKQREDRLFVIEALLKALRVGVSDLFVVDHYNVENSSFKQIDAGQLEQYVQHIVELNAAVAAARSKGRSNPDFERANTIIYLRQLDEYWGRICRRLYEFERFQPLVERYLDGLREMSDPLPLLYKDTVLDPGARDRFLREGRMDLLRLALKTGDTAVLLDLLRRPKPTPEQLVALRGVDETADEVVTRAWSFRREAPRGALQAPKPLKDTVRRIIVHTGLPKTGSSSLQQFLERNRFRLLEAGIYYPSTGANREFHIRRERTPGHAALFQAISDGVEGIDLQLAREVQDISKITGHKVDTLILSAENLVSSRFWDHGQNFADMLAPFDVEQLEVVCVLRHPVGWLQSLYVEMCGTPWNGFTDSLQEFAGQLERLGLFDFDAIAKTLEAPEQVSRLHMGIFEQIRKNGGIETWFFDLIGASSAGFVPVERSLSNESLTPAQTAIMRNLKRMPDLDREDLACLFTQISQNVPSPKEPTARMLQGLTQFEITHQAQIKAYENAHGVKGPALGRVRAAQPDLEAETETLLGELSENRLFRQDQELIQVFLQRLDAACHTSNIGRIIQLKREERRVTVSVPLQPGEDIKRFAIHHRRGVEKYPLLNWEGSGMGAICPHTLSRLWREGTRDIEIRAVAGKRIGKRPFRIVQFLPDRSFWLVPIAFLPDLKADKLDAYLD